MGDVTYERRLAESLEAKGDSLDRNELKQLKESFKLFQVGFASIYSVLMKKGIIHDDPYRYDMKISDIECPDETPFAENEKIDQMSIRLSQFDNYLEFLTNYYQFSTAFLNMGRIKRLVAFIKYFNFQNFSENSQHINTRGLAELIGSVRKGTDQLSIGILNEGLYALDRATKEIMLALKDLTAYHREFYKLRLRQNVLGSLDLKHDYVYTHKEETVKLVKRKFAEACPQEPFYPELVEEAISEDFLDESGERRESILRELGAKKEVKKDSVAQANYRLSLLEGIRALAGSGFQLEDAVTKLKENSEILEAKKQTFIGKLRMAIRRIFNPHADELVYELEYLDPVTGERSNEDVNFTRFAEEVSHRAKLYEALSSRGSPQYKRVEAAPEEQAYKILDKSLEELQQMFKRMTALDEFFKSAVPVAERQRLRGIKVELNTLKNAIIKANQKKHEFVSLKEEAEQMKKLGIHAEQP
jgi:hypothetical protein